MGNKDLEGFLGKKTKKWVDGFINEAFAINPSNNKTNQFVRFTNPERTEGVLPDGTKVKTTATGSSYYGGYGTLVSGNIWVVHADQFPQQTIQGNPSKTPYILIRDQVDLTKFYVRKGTDTTNYLVPLSLTIPSGAGTPYANLIGRFSISGKHLIFIAFPPEQYNGAVLENPTANISWQVIQNFTLNTETSQVGGTITVGVLPRAWTDITDNPPAPDNLGGGAGWVPDTPETTSEQHTITFNFGGVYSTGVTPAANMNTDLAVDFICKWSATKRSSQRFVQTLPPFPGTKITINLENTNLGRSATSGFTENSPVTTKITDYETRNIVTSWVYGGPILFSPSTGNSMALVGAFRDKDGNRASMSTLDPPFSNFHVWDQTGYTDPITFFVTGPESIAFSSSEYYVQVSPGVVSINNGPNLTVDSTTRIKAIMEGKFSTLVPDQRLTEYTKQTDNSYKAQHYNVSDVSAFSTDDWIVI